MAYILQVDFDFTGPFGDEMAVALKELAESINTEKGFMWKIWTENQETQEAGGIYAFETKEDAKNYLEKHTKRLNGFGIMNINGKIFEVNKQLTLLNRGPLK